MSVDSRSRVEDILHVTLGNLDPSALQPPQSRVEALLQDLYREIEDFDGKIPIHICTYDEYDHETGMPTIEDPDENTFYLVPANESGDDMYIEWIFTEGNRWERFGSGGGTVTIEQSDWNQNDSTQADFIKNKPDLTLKLDKNQGAANSGKFMGVNSSGNVVPLEVEGGNIAVTEELVSGEDYELTVEEGETGSVISVAGKTGTVTLDGDDVVFNDAATYNDGTIGGTVADLKSAITIQNLTPSVTWDEDGDGKLINQNGVIAASSGFHYSDLLEVCNGSGKVSWSYNSSASTIRVHGYDSNGTWIKQLGYKQNVTTGGELAFDISEDVKYIRISCSKSYSNVTAQATETVADKLSVLQDRTENLEEAVDQNQTDTKEVNVTSGSAVNSSLTGTYNKNERFLLGLTLKSGTFSSGLRLLVTDSSNNRYGYVALDETLEFVLPNDSTYFNIYQSGTAVTGSGVITFTVTRLSVNDRISSVESKIDKINTYVPAVNYALPEYYFNPYTDTDSQSHASYIGYKVDRINELAKAAVGNGDAFVFITDSHWLQNAKKSPNLLNYIAENTHISNLVCGGDTADGGSDVYCNALRDAWGRNVHFAVGNHEYDASGTNSKLYYMMDMMNNDEIGNPQKHYYYYDNVQAKIRYIVLNSDGNDSFSNDQLAWFTDEALSVESGWGIIIFVHWLYMIDWGTDEISLGASRAEPFISAINGYSGNGEIIAVFQGHVHRDRITFTQTDGIPVIITTCDKYMISQSSGHKDIDVTRTAKNITEQAFDVVIVNRSTKTLNIVRVGGLARDGIGDNPGDTVDERTVQWS